MIRAISITTAVLMCTCASAATERPNILFIMADDHSIESIGAYGGRLADLDPSPTIDALAAAGTRFDNVFVTNSICSPSRATILTGQYSQTNGVRTLGGKVDAGNQRTPRTKRRCRRAGADADSATDTKVRYDDCLACILQAIAAR